MLDNILTYDIKWRDDIYNEIFNLEEYKYENIVVEKGDVVIDLGANIGVFSLYALSKNAKIIYAFEPIKEYAELYKKNLINCPVVIYQSAISNHTGKAEIIYNYQDNTILSKVFKDFNWEIQSNKKIEIDTMSFNDFANDLDKIDFLKVDIEGSEYDLFENMSIENLNKIRKIGCEYHWNYENRLNLTINKLVENNFKVYTFITSDTYKVGKLFAIKYEILSTLNKDCINISHLIKNPD